MGDHADAVNHAPKPEVARAPAAPERDVWQPLAGTPGPGSTTQTSLPPLDIVRSARKAPDQLANRRQVGGSDDRHHVILHLQRIHGNSYAARTIAQARTVEPSPVKRQTYNRRGLLPLVITDPRKPIQRDWLDDLGEIVDEGADMASGAYDSASETVGEAASAVGDAASDAAGAVSDAAGDIVDSAQALIGGAISQLREAYDAIAGQISAAWETLRGGVESAITAAFEEATGFLGGIGALFSGIGETLVGLDAAKLQGVWGGITATASLLLGSVKGISARVLAVLDGQWNNVKKFADGLIGNLRGKADGIIDELPGAVQGAARSIWNKIEATAKGTWATIEKGWTTARTWASDKLNQLVAKVEGIVKSVDKSVIAPLIEALTNVAQVFKVIKQAIDNPEGFLAPLVQHVTGLLQDLPGRARAEAETQINAAAKGGAAAPTATAAPSVQRTIQRDGAKPGDPRSTLGVGTVLSATWDALSDKVTKLWGGLGGAVKEILLSMVYPPATWAALKQDWSDMVKELSTRATRFESIRTDSFEGFWEDLRRFVSNLLDFPLIIWRAAYAMVGRLSVYIGLALIVGGAIGGAFMGAFGGAVAGGAAGGGAGAAPGGGGGALGGAIQGAKAGYLLAEKFGLAVLTGFVAGEVANIAKSIADLLATPQTKDEQEEDVNHVADSAIAIAAAAILMAVAFLGVTIAKWLVGMAKKLVSRVRLKVKPKVADPAEPIPIEPVPGKGSKVIICRACVELTNVPEDILTRRAKLSPEMQQYLDEKLNGFVKDPLNPKIEEFTRLRKMMDGVEKANGGDLEKGLLASKARETPVVKPPFGSEVAELPRLRDAAEKLMAEIDDFVAKNPDKKTILRARRRVRDDVEGVLKDMESGKTEATPERIEGFENNLKGVKGEFESAKTAPPGSRFGEKRQGREIDEITFDGTRWFNDKTDNLFGVEDPRVAEMMAQAEATIKAAQMPAEAVPVPGGPPGATMAPEVEFRFKNGVTPEVAAKLRTVEVNGQRLNVSGQELPLPNGGTP